MTSTEFKIGDKVKVEGFEAKVTYVNGSGSLDVEIDDDTELECVPAKLASLVEPAKPAPGSIVKFERWGTFLVGEGDALTRLFSDGDTSTGYRWSINSKFLGSPRKFEVLAQV